MSVESISIINSKSLTRLESGLFVDLPKLKSINFQRNGIEWIHLRALTSTLMSLQLIDLSFNRISNAGMIGRAIKDIQSLETLNLNHNFIEVLTEASFVDLPRLKELRLNDNLIHVSNFC
jgi:Leucine-rich repeat (LRR) protein